MSRRTGDRLLPAALTLLLLAPGTAEAQAGRVKFSATVDRQEMTLDETLQLTVSITADEKPGNLVLPDGNGMKDFEVLQRSQSQQTTFSFGSGGPRSQHTRIFTLVLRPLRTGTLTIPSATCTLHDDDFDTRQIQIKVVEGGGGRAPPRRNPAVPAPPFGVDDDPFADLLEQFGERRRPTTEQDLFLRTVVDRKEAYLGEQITLSIYLMSRVDISNVEGIQMPALDGFWAEDLASPTQITAEIRYLEGVPYRVYLLKRRALFPTRSGNLTIQAVEADVHTGLGFFFSGRKVHRRSEPQRIAVRPLPKGAPQGFESVNVGTYELSAELSAPSVPVGQPVALKIVGKGRGNIRSLALPKVAGQQGLKAFEPTVTDQVGHEAGKISGSKSSETLLVAQRSGEHVIPSLEWHVFDPSAERYVTHRTPELRFQAVASGAPTVAGGPTSTNLLAGGLRPPRHRVELSPRRGAPWKGALFSVALAGPPLLLAAASLGDRIRERLRRGDGSRRTRRAAARARRRLQNARKLLGEGRPADFYAEVARALLDYTADKLGRPVTGLTRDALAMELVRAGGHGPAIAVLLEALAGCDTGRFSPEAARQEQKEKILEAAQQAMERLEEAHWKPVPAGVAA
jgi:hypothetical protein